jgi:methionyl-tRNA formyltransferase
MRLVFAGTPTFAERALAGLLSAGHDVALVLTQADRPAGRGMQLRASEVKRTAQRYGLPVHQPASLKAAEACAALSDARAHAMVVAAYGLILPQPVLDLFPLGCINIHASLLPRWRGAAPIQRAILAGDAQTGISIMRMDAGLDTGPVYATEALPILARDTAASLHDRLAELGARLLVDTLPRIAAGALQPRPQAQSGVTYAHKITKREAELDWQRSAVELERQVRAFDPFPVANTRLRNETLRVWSAAVAADAGGGAAGTLALIDEEAIVQCGQGALRLEELQRAGGKRMPARELLRGLALRPGERLGEHG